VVNSGFSVRPVGALACGSFSENGIIDVSQGGLSEDKVI
jgi:hypothetical protein